MFEIFKATKAVFEIQKQVESNAVDIKELKTQVFNHIPTQIGELDKKTDEKFLYLLKQNDDNFKHLNERMDDNFKHLNDRIDSLNSRMDSLITMMAGKNKSP